jgi:2-octaprenylphenol hydroxylase
MKKAIDVLIVGAGVTGLTVAALLAQSQHRDRLKLTLVDAAARPVHVNDDDVALRVSAIATGSAKLLNLIGAWPYIAATRACGYERMCVWDEGGSADGAAALRFDAAEFAVPQLGFIVENVLIQHALLAVLDRLDIELRFETKIDSLDADLVIGADGARSFVRDKAGIKTRDYPYGQTAFVTHLQPSESHQKTAWQRFMTDGPLGMLPLADGRISVVWSTHDALVGRAQSASDEELGEILSEASDYVLGDLAVAGPRGAFPLCARHAEQYVMPGVALIGDAAHAVHPLAGQGANLGLQDAAALADVIDQALRNDEHPGDRPVLRRYERARKGQNAAMLHFMTVLNRLFTTDSAFVREMRAGGMRLFNASGPIRDHVVNVALGGSK